MCSSVAVALDNTDTQCAVIETSDQISFLIEPQEQQKNGFPEGTAGSYFNKTP